MQQGGRILSPLQRLPLAGVTLLVCAALAGCRSKSLPAPAPAASASGSSRADLFASPDDLDHPLGLAEDAGAGSVAGGGDLPAEPDRGLEVRLKDPGAEPRTPLTYDVAIGKPQTVVLKF